MLRELANKNAITHVYYLAQTKTVIRKRLVNLFLLRLVNVACSVNVFNIATFILMSICLPSKAISYIIVVLNRYY